MISFQFSNYYTYRCFNPDGSLAWEEKIKNFVTNEGLNDTLNYLRGTGHTFYLGLIDQINFTSLLSGDTAAKITTTIPTGATNNWKEFAGYNETARQVLTLSVPSGQSTDNSASPATFTININGTLVGGFVISDSTKGGAVGILWGESLFTTPKIVTNGQVIQVSLQFTDASA